MHKVVTISVDLLAAGNLDNARFLPCTAAGVRTTSPDRHSISHVSTPQVVLQIVAPDGRPVERYIFGAHLLGPQGAQPLTLKAQGFCHIDCMRSIYFRMHARAWLGTRITPPTSVPGLGSPRPRLHHDSAKAAFVEPLSATSLATATTTADAERAL